MTKNLPKIISTLCLAIALISCVSEVCEDNSMNSDTSETVARSLKTRSTGQIEAAYQTLPNPYTLKVMQKIYDDYSIDAVTLQPTDLYVRFMPQDSAQFRTLYDRHDLELFDYPLDIFLEEGEEYINPELDEDDLPWLYTTVKPDFVFPDNVLYEIIDTCYIPSEEETIIQTRAAEIDIEAIAFGRMGYDVDTVDIPTRLPGSKIHPAGTIEVYKDSLYPNVPVKGVKVRCHNIVKWDTCYTDEMGHYSMEKSFKTNVHYAVVFDNKKDFDIWGNRWPVGRATYNMGWKDNAGYSTIISRSNIAWEWAAVNNAAYDYYLMCEETGITKPPQHIAIWVCKKAKKSSAPMLLSGDRQINDEEYYGILNFTIDIDYDSIDKEDIDLMKFILPDITVGTKNRDYHNIFETVNHELAHASHFSKVGNIFWKKYRWYIIKHWGYGDGTGNNSELCGIGEMWGYSMGYIQQYELEGHKINVGNFPHSAIEGWIKPHAFGDLYAAKTLTKKQIYDCLTPTVDTYDELIDKMTSSYPSKADSIKIAFARNGIVPRNMDVCTCPPVDSIKIGEPFVISWGYATDRTLHDIEFRFVKEKYFDGSSTENIQIATSSPDQHSACIRINQPGYYIIEAKVKGTDIKKYFHVAKHYKPEFSLPGSEMGEGTEPLTRLGTRFGNPYTISVTFGSNKWLEKRLVALTRVNYRQMTANFDFRRIDVRLVHAGLDTLKADTWDSSVIALPELYNYIHEETVYDPVDSDTEHLPESVTYTTKSHGYYTISYPDDRSDWVE